MPSTSKKQHNFMEAVAHSPAFAKKVGIPQSVGKDFSTADKGKTFKKGGTMATKKKINPKMMAALMAARQPAMPPAGAAAPAPMGPPGGMPPPPMGGAPGGAPGMRRGGMTKKMAKGGMAEDDTKQDKKLIKKAFGMHDKQEHKGEHTDLSKLKKGGMPMKKMAKGGGVKEARMMPAKMEKVKTNTKAPHGDGIAERGKTRVMMPKMSGSTTGMRKGGMARGR